MTTYWLYYGSKIVGCERMPAGASRQAVISQALEWHDKLPLSDMPNENPSERRYKIARAEVRVFPD